MNTEQLETGAREFSAPPSVDAKAWTLLYASALVVAGCYKFTRNSESIDTWLEEDCLSAGMNVQEAVALSIARDRGSFTFERFARAAILVFEASIESETGSDGRALRGCRTRRERLKSHVSALREALAKSAQTATAGKSGAGG